VLQFFRLCSCTSYMINWVFRTRMVIFFFFFILFLLYFYFYNHL
jgi:hypothetical protein